MTKYIKKIISNNQVIKWRCYHCNCPVGYITTGEHRSANLDPDADYLDIGCNNCGAVSSYDRDEVTAR